LATREEHHAKLHQDLADHARDRTKAERRLARAWTAAHDTLRYHGLPEADRQGPPPKPWDPELKDDHETPPVPEAAPGYPHPDEATAAGEAQQTQLTSVAEVEKETAPWLPGTPGERDPLLTAETLTEAAARERDKAAAFARQWRLEDARYRKALTEARTAREEWLAADEKARAATGAPGEPKGGARDALRTADGAYAKAREKLETRHGAVVRARERFLAAQKSARRSGEPDHRPWYPEADPETYERATDDDPAPDPYTVLDKDGDGEPLSLTGPDGTTVLDLVEPPSSKQETGAEGDSTGQGAARHDPDTGTGFHRSLLHALRRADPEKFAALRAGQDAQAVGDVTTPALITPAEITPVEIAALKNKLAAQLSADKDELAGFLAVDDWDRFTADDLAEAGIQLDSAQRQEFETWQRLPKDVTLTADQRLALARKELLRAGDDRIGYRKDTGWNHAGGDLLPLLAARALGVPVTVVRGDLGFQKFLPHGTEGAKEAQPERGGVVLHVKDDTYRSAVPRPDAQEAQSTDDATEPASLEGTTTLVLPDGSRHTLNPVTGPGSRFAESLAASMKAVEKAGGKEAEAATRHGVPRGDEKREAAGVRDRLARELEQPRFPDLGDELLFQHPFTQADLDEAGVRLAPGQRAEYVRDGRLPSSVSLTTAQREALGRRMFPAADDEFTPEELAAAGLPPGPLTPAALTDG
ncbi:hypothetical protein ADK38_16850, partial [Streptomyces varsoviensis]